MFGIEIILFVALFVSYTTAGILGAVISAYLDRYRGGKRMKRYLFFYTALFMLWFAIVYDNILDLIPR